MVKKLILFTFCLMIITFCNAQKTKLPNTQHPEILGKWRPDKFLGVNPTDNSFELKKAINNDKPDNKYGNFVEINKDLTFRSYSQGWCGMGCELEIKGTYSFDNKGRIIFSFQKFIYIGSEDCKGREKQKSFVSGPFSFKKEVGVLILKMNKQ